MDAYRGVRGRWPPRFVGIRGRRLVADALAEAKRRRPSAKTGPVLEPFALVARGEGSVEIKVPSKGSAIEALLLAVARESVEQPAVVVFEAAADGEDVFVIDLFTRGASSAARWIMRIDEP